MNIRIRVSKYSTIFKLQNQNKLQMIAESYYVLSTSQRLCCGWIVIRFRVIIKISRCSERALLPIKKYYWYIEHINT